MDERSRRMLRAERGQALVEMAFVLPLLLLVVFGIIDFGVLFLNGIAVTNAARTGARYATTHPTAWSTIQGRVQQAGGTTQIPNTAVEIVYQDTRNGGVTECGRYHRPSNSFRGANGYTQDECVVPGNLIEVKVTVQHQMLTPFLKPLFTNGKITLATSATMAQEVEG